MSTNGKDLQQQPHHPTVRLMGIAKHVTLAGSTPEYYVTLCNQFGCLDPLICLNSKIMMFIYLLYLLNWSKRLNHSFFGNFNIAWWSSKTAVPYGMLVQPSSSCEATAKVTPHRVNDRRAATWLPPTAPLSASSYFIVDFCSLMFLPSGPIADANLDGRKVHFVGALTICFWCCFLYLALGAKK